MRSICDWAMEGGGGWAGKLVAFFFFVLFLLFIQNLIGQWVISIPGL